jgi:hypothetical protein
VKLLRKDLACSLRERFFAGLKHRASPARFARVPWESEEFSSACRRI